MKKLLSSLCLILSLTACDNQKEVQQPNGKPVVKIGFITSLTGQFAEVGNNTKVAIDLAKEDVNSQNLDFNFIVEDYGYESSRAATAAGKLINIDKVDSLISWSSKGGNVVAPIAQNSKVLNFSISNDKHISQSGIYNFIHWTQSDALVKKFMENIDKKNYKKIAMFVVEQASLQHDSDIIENLLKQKGIEVERANFSMDNRDFGLAIEKMKSKNFDAWFIALLPPSLDIFLDNFFLKEVNKPILSIDTLTFAKDKLRLEGVEYVTISDGNKELLNRIKQKNNSTNFFGVGYVYDVAKMLMYTYDDFYTKYKRIPSSEEMSEALLKIKDFDGAVGKISIDKDRTVQSQAVIKKMTNGVPVEIEE